MPSYEQRLVTVGGKNSLLIEINFQQSHQGGWHRQRKIRG